jgi:hypothetical protein
MAIRENDDLSVSTGIKKTLELLLAAGPEPQQAIRYVGGGKLIASVKDADGNITGLIQST